MESGAIWHDDAMVEKLHVKTIHVSISLDTFSVYIGITL